jgi:hypothetical protein
MQQPIPEDKGAERRKLIEERSIQLSSANFVGEPDLGAQDSFLITLRLILGAGVPGYGSATHRNSY